jgi:drug/metabolite transporter (DMT)-like permease
VRSTHSKIAVKMMLKQLTTCLGIVMALSPVAEAFTTTPPSSTGISLHHSGCVSRLPKPCGSGSGFARPVTRLCMSLKAEQKQRDAVAAEKEEGGDGGGTSSPKEGRVGGSEIGIRQNGTPFFATLTVVVERPAEETEFVDTFDPLLIGEMNKVDQIIEDDMDHMKEDKEEIGLWVARGLLLVVAILWGTNFASVKYLETLCFHPPCNHPPSEAALARFGVAAIAGLPFLVGQRFDVILAGLECGIYICLGYFTQALALSYISSGQCAFICSLTVVVVPILSFFLYGKGIKSSNVTSGILALAGVAVLEGLVDFDSLLGIQPAVAAAASSTTAAITEGAEAMVASSSAAVASAGAMGGMEGFVNEYKGDLLALGQPIGFGLAFMRIEQYVEQFKDVKNRVLTISAAQCLAAGFISMLWVLYDYHGIIPNMEYMVRVKNLDARD